MKKTYLLLLTLVAACGPDVPVPADACDPSVFLGTDFSTSESSMGECYGPWRYRTDTMVSYCPRSPGALSCPSAPLDFMLSDGVVVSSSGSY